MNRYKSPALLLAFLFLLMGCDKTASTAKAQNADADPPLKADFSGATGWVNTDKPISTADLKGQVVLLDFWTYCCINCMHVFPDLKYLEEKYKNDPVVIIGVHSGKFDEEKDADHIRQAVLRHNITHPVVVDNDMKVWNGFGVRSWPTLVLIGPDGKIIGGVSGEGNRAILDQAIAGLLKDNKDKGILGNHMTFKSERASFKSGLLEFPGKVRADGPGKRLFVSDTNHHRVLVCDLDGKIIDTIGAGSIGLKDGSFAETQFHQPQGLALSPDGKLLYVADTENHAVRVVDLSAKTVATLAGTGAQFHGFEPQGQAAKAELSSPWDLAVVGEKLYIAMAGTHQIWTVDLKDKSIALFAGNRHEAAREGPNLEASFAQPSGLATDGKTLYVADSEASSIRAVELSPRGSAHILAGSGDLFGFGRTDGPARDARFQHPLGVALNGDTLFVADTFNNLIRTIDLKSGEVKTFLGSGKSDPGAEDAIGLYEPGGLSILGDTLYIADTNHHRIVATDIKTKKSRVVMGGSLG